MRKRVRCLLVSNAYSDFRDMQPAYIKPRDLYRVGDVGCSRYSLDGCGVRLLATGSTGVNWFFYDVTGVALSGQILIYKLDDETGEMTDLLDNDWERFTDHNYYELRELARAMYLDECDHHLTQLEP